MSALPGVAQFPESDRRQSDYDAFFGKGACINQRPELFFPTNGAGANRARRICKQCPVREQCLEYAMKYEERYGYWGGTSESDRKRLRRERANA